MAETPRKISTKAAGAVSAAVMCSRVLGLLRDQILNGLFGAGREMDAFLMAFRTPNLLRDLFAEGALSTAFVTTFSKKMSTEGDAAAWRLASKMATLVTVFMAGITLLGIIAAPLIIKIVAPWFDPEKAALTIVLTRIMYPFILLVSLAALVMGMLNAKDIFGMPAMASSFFNIGSIVGGVTIGWWIDPRFGERALIGLAIGTLIGGLFQLAVQLPALRGVGFRFRPDFQWRDEGVQQILRLMGPAVIAASSVQINVTINGIFASSLGHGPITWLQIAFRLMQLPLGVFGVAIATVTLPVISRSAAVGNIQEFRAILARGMRLAFLLTVPSAIGLMLLAEPIISVLFEHGRFLPFMTRQTAAALQLYSIGLVAYAGMKVLVPAFYAIDKRKTPMVVSFIAIGVNLLLNGLFTFKLGMGHRGLALSTGCVALTNFVVLYVLMHRETKLLGTRLMLISLGKMLAAGALLAVVCWSAQRWLLADWTHLSFKLRAVYLFATITAGAAVFFITAMFLRIEELEDLASVVRRRLTRFKTRR
jgi:putative peptidoglycan lipid II flippase